MLKIYLDWNSINNIQTRHPKLYELIKEYGHLFIFPYSNAHIRDLMVSKDENNPFYQRDIATLSTLKAIGINCLASTTIRNTVMTPDGKKLSDFGIVQFREY